MIVPVSAQYLRRLLVVFNRNTVTYSWARNYSETVSWSVGASLSYSWGSITRFRPSRASTAWERDNFCSNPGESFY